MYMLCTQQASQEEDRTVYILAVESPIKIAVCALLAAVPSLARLFGISIKIPAGYYKSGVLIWAELLMMY